MEAGLISNYGYSSLKSANNSKNTEKLLAKRIDSTQELSEEEEMTAFKKEFYDDLSKIISHRSISNAAVNISESAFENMKADPEYREKVLSLIKRDLQSAYRPGSTSVVLTVGATLDDYRGDSWSVGYDSEFYSRSQNSFYKKTSKNNDTQKKQLKEYAAEKSQAKKLQQKLLNEKIAKQQLEDKQLLQEWNNKRIMTQASAAYEASFITQNI